ncbi:MAG: hypothetical protein GXP17_10180 [Gammaproteobacteria bacterium]|nr:hypothetical protein [Gammaproteobacteria bacterium]
MFARTLTAITLFTLAATASAQKLDMNFGQSSVRLVYTSLIGGSTFGRTEMSSGILYNEDNNTVLDIGLQVIDVAGSKTPGLEIGVGPKLYWVSVDTNSASGVAVALGGKLSYKVRSLPRMRVQGSLHYAPSITSTLDVDSLMEVSTRVGYELLPTANVYLGYRRIRVDFNLAKQTQTLDRGVFIGLEMTF